MLRRAWLALALLLICMLPAQAAETVAPDLDAGSWKTWIIQSGQQFRVPPPPDRAATEKEAVEVAQIAGARDNAALDRIAYWDTGAPSYRWSELATAEYLKNGANWLMATRGMSLMHIASAAAQSGKDGVGLGLSIVRSIVENHDGRVGAENVPAGGASFWFELPISA